MCQVPAGTFVCEWTGAFAPKGSNWGHFNSPAVDKLVGDNPDKIDRVYRDGDGIWLDLRRGWRAGLCDYTHTLHEYSAREIVSAFREVHPCDCEECVQQPV